MTVQNLNERAMLMRLSIHQWSAQRKDKRISAEVAQRHGADETMGRYTKNLIAREALESISTLSSQIVTAWRKWTLPWLDGGMRILPSPHFFKANTEVKELIHKREAEVSNFLASYEDHVEKARRALNGMFDPTDYPSIAQLRRAFDVEFDVFPIPSGEDFRVPLGDDQGEVQRQIDAAVARALELATRDAWQRIHTVVDRMVDRLNAYNVDPGTGKVISTFRDSLVENIRDLVELLPGLNVAGDADLDAMRDRLEKQLCTFDADLLRTSEDLRAKVADQAAAILSEVSDFLA